MCEWLVLESQPVNSAGVSGLRFSLSLTLRSWHPKSWDSALLILNKSVIYHLMTLVYPVCLSWDQRPRAEGLCPPVWASDPVGLCPGLVQGLTGSGSDQRGS